jgi:hypothetical protein
VSKRFFVPVRFSIEAMGFIAIRDFPLVFHFSARLNRVFSNS